MKHVTVVTPSCCKESSSINAQVWYLCFAVPKCPKQMPASIKRNWWAQRHMILIDLIISSSHFPFLFTLDTLFTCPLATAAQYCIINKHFHLHYLFDYFDGLCWLKFLCGLKLLLEFKTKTLSILWLLFGLISKMPHIPVIKCFFLFVSVSLKMLSSHSHSAWLGHFSVLSFSQLQSSFNTNTHFLPLLRQLCLSDSTQTEKWMPSPAHCQKFYQVPLTKDQVRFVDTPEALQKCRNIVLKVHHRWVNVTLKKGFVFLAQIIVITVEGFSLYLLRVFLVCQPGLCSFLGRGCGRSWYGVAADIWLHHNPASCPDTARSFWPGFLIRSLCKWILSTPRYY